METERFLTESLRKAAWGRTAAEIMAAALNAVDPYTAVQRHMAVSGETLVCGGEKIDLDGLDKIYLVGAGKAGLPMAQAAADLLGERIAGGLVIVKEGYGGVDRIGKVYIREAGHPLPDQRGVAATQQLLELVSAAGENDLVLCVISGGGSALLTAPVEGLELEGLRELTDALLASGAGIEEINTLRKQLDLVKGGGLARAAYPARVISLILSDVVGDPLGMIASGPTVANPATFEDSLEILARYDLLGYVPDDLISRWHVGEEFGILDCDRVRNLLVGSNTLAANAALEQARKTGLDTYLLTTELEGEAREVGVRLAEMLRQAVEKGTPIMRPGMIIAGGETTVTLHGSGLGGRNQELALTAVEGLAGLEHAALVTLATDGGDGSSVGAGAVVTGDTLARARSIGMEPADYLAENDSDAFFRVLGDQIVTGPTRTNVNDLVFMFVY